MTTVAILILNDWLTASYKPEHSTTAAQGVFWQVTLLNEHVWLVKHPPLSISQDGSQYVSFVGSNTLHRVPLGHSKSHSATQSQINQTCMHEHCAFQIVRGSWSCITTCHSMSTRETMCCTYKLCKGVRIHWYAYTNSSLEFKQAAISAKITSMFSFLKHDDIWTASDSVSQCYHKEFLFTI